VPLEILLVGPLLALVVLAVIAIASDVTSPRPAARSTGSAPVEEFGLLRTVTLGADMESARAVRDRLHAFGIRATIGTDRAGFVRVLVFVDEYDRAKDAV
jgi:hypothetical protein